MEGKNGRRKLHLSCRGYLQRCNTPLQNSAASNHRFLAHSSVSQECAHSSVRIARLSSKCRGLEVTCMQWYKWLIWAASSEKLLLLCMERRHPLLAPRGLFHMLLHLLSPRGLSLQQGSLGLLIGWLREPKQWSSAFENTGFLFSQVWVGCI